MKDEPWSRRGLLAGIGTALAGGLAGCSIGSPEPSDATPEDGGEDASQAASGGTDGTTREVEPDSETGTRRLDDETSEATSEYSRVYRQVADSVAAVRVSRPGGTARGTAWVYDDTHLVTNEHVVSDVESVSVWFSSDGWRAARVVGTDVYSDLAVLAVEDVPDAAAPLSLVERDPPIGTQVAAIGNPFGLTGSLSTGVVSGRNRTLPAPNGFSIADAIQTDAPVNPGNSGGPLVDLEGDVVGVVNSGGGDNIGFAISAAMVSRVVPSLIRTGDYEHSYMGIGLVDMTPDLAEANDLSEARGLYVDEVVDGGPSDGVLRGTTGSRVVDGRQVETGGDVVVRLGQTEIQTTQTLSTFLALETSPGDTVAVTVIREGSREELRLRLGSRPEP
jgi:S1-C subfamily serine protease